MLASRSITKFIWISFRLLMPIRMECWVQYFLRGTKLPPSLKSYISHTCAFTAFNLGVDILKILTSTVVLWLPPSLCRKRCWKRLWWVYQASSLFSPAFFGRTRMNRPCCSIQAWRKERNRLIGEAKNFVWHLRHLFQKWDNIQLPL